MLATPFLSSGLAWHPRIHSDEPRGQVWPIGISYPTDLGGKCDLCGKTRSLTTMGKMVHNHGFVVFLLLIGPYKIECSEFPNKNVENPFLSFLSYTTKASTIG